MNQASTQDELEAFAQGAAAASGKSEGAIRAEVRAAYIGASREAHRFGQTGDLLVLRSPSIGYLNMSLPKS
jgi:hypothetical protein